MPSEEHAEQNGWPFVWVVDSQSVHTIAIRLDGVEEKN